MQLAASVIADGVPLVPDKAWDYGLPAVVACLFLWGIIHLWRTGRADLKSGQAEREKFLEKQRQDDLDREKERANWALEREQMHTEHEKGLKENAESYAMRLEELRDQMLSREDAIRREYADRMERVANEANQSAEKLNAVLDKLFARFVGPRRGRTERG